jgi:hypothetical protein
MRVIGGACDGYGSWHDIEHRKRSCTCCVEDTHPPSTEGLETISDCTTDLHLQRVLLSNWPRPGPGSALATGLLHALLDLSGWARWSVIKVLNQVFSRQVTCSSCLWLLTHFEKGRHLPLRDRDCHRRTRGCPGGELGPTSCGRRCIGEGGIVGCHLGRWINCLHLGP